MAFDSTNDTVSATDKCSQQIYSEPIQGINGWSHTCNVERRKHKRMAHAFREPRHADSTQATYSDQQIRDAYEREYEQGDVDGGMLATMLDQQQREIERLRAKITALREVSSGDDVNLDKLLADVRSIIRE